jgi:hypothetical protein
MAPEVGGFLKREGKHVATVAATHQTGAVVSPEAKQDQRGDGPGEPGRRSAEIHNSSEPGCRRRPRIVNALRLRRIQPIRHTFPLVEHTTEYEHLFRYLRTESTSLIIFCHYIVEVLMRRTASTSLRSLTDSLPFRALPTAVAQLLSARVNSVGNRWRPHHGGFHE